MNWFPLSSDYIIELNWWEHGRQFSFEYGYLGGGSDDALNLSNKLSDRDPNLRLTFKLKPGYILCD